MAGHARRLSNTQTATQPTTSLSPQQQRRPGVRAAVATGMENPHEERQALLLERIIKNVDLVNDALVEMNRSLQEVNAYNTKVTVVGELWEGVSTRTGRPRGEWSC